MNYSDTSNPLSVDIVILSSSLNCKEFTESVSLSVLCLCRQSGPDNDRFRPFSIQLSSVLIDLLPVFFSKLSKYSTLRSVPFRLEAPKLQTGVSVLDELPMLCVGVLFTLLSSRLVV